MCWLYLLYVPISLFRISLLGLRHGEPSLCGCRWPLCLLWLFFDRFWLREEWALIRVSKSATGAADTKTCQRETWEEVRNPPSKVHFLFNNVYRKKQGALFIQLKPPAETLNPENPCLLCYYCLISSQWGCDMGKLHTNMFVGGNKCSLCVVLSRRLED